MSDVYSFGVLLAFLFTGRHSPDVPVDMQVCKHVSNARAHPLTHIRIDASPYPAMQFAHMLLKLLATFSSFTVVA